LLEVYLYRNRLQLTTPDACYSDGDKYTPVVGAAKYLKAALPDIKNVLALGTGLGSIVRILSSDGIRRDFTLVEIDKVILGWALEFLADCPADVKPVCSDAAAFMDKNRTKYDMIFVDVFISKTVPDFVTSPGFLEQCRGSLNPGGYVALNYIVNDEKDWVRVQTTFTAIFPKHHVITMGINRVLIAG
jgi:spermidine synthase